MDEHFSFDGHDDGGATDGRRRSEPRDSLFLHATLHRIGMDDPVTVRVRNLSPGGMMAELGTSFEPGDRLAISLRGVGDVEGTVRWRELGRIGVAFDTPVDPQRARKTVGQRPTTAATTLSPPRPKRPKLFGR